MYIDRYRWLFHRMGLLHSMLPARRVIPRLLSCYYKQELVWSRRQRWGGVLVKIVILNNAHGKTPCSQWEKRKKLYNEVPPFPGSSPPFGRITATQNQLVAVNNHCVVWLQLNVPSLILIHVQTGQTPLYIASWEGHDQIVELLLKKEADVNHQIKVRLLLLACVFLHEERFFNIKNNLWLGYKHNHW